ncbi:nucleoside-triphosphatase [Lacinutrix sp. C3R15]|uniref:nucleoside-triphosphatase n=1 Tax=Flavobacteriaceae TaxID=49546 RepID=UPI001C0A3A1A|nr:MULTISPECIES: nucleoside-triphosphatase [Flavobacteriaceae]MBU2939160.1 nucleoside-triphosphatase [Lacinutrix sp. C3R15]MDO6622476.1 nucleoside-triphosphatase [Oceanihabitans sp. 1_MG-2023]
MIFILTGKIRTGKTTTLLDWISNRSDVDGLLCPDGEDGKRYFFKIKANETFKLETEAELETENVIKIGSYIFLESAFVKANDYLISVASKTKCKYVIIDELGKLELKNEGLHRSAEALISSFKSNTIQHLILVIRDYLLEDILIHYNITEYSLLKKEDLK